MTKAQLKAERARLQAAQFKAASLEVGAIVVLSSGAYYPTRRAKVTGHKVTAWGTITHVEIVDGWESDDEHAEIYRTGHAETIEGSETLAGIGWKRAEP